ncbi:MAG TPA: glycoside hydrolase family 38 C-terminal domain-containing protein [Armatimonadota bacterium]|jgi:alpha-mannosidase
MKITPRRKCFLVCNAHLDPVWLWPWEDGLVEAISTFRVAADFCDTYPDFVFNHNESLLYEWVERNDPELFARIQDLVARGRWHIAGGAFLQPDLIGSSGESLIRQYLVGKRYFRDKFGVEPTTAYNFDSFGHPQGLIQILAGCGFDSYVFCRPSRGELSLPVGAFRWRHASGVEIIARRSDDHYITQGKIREEMLEGDHVAHYTEEGDFMFLWGIGNHGGGPSRAEYADLLRLSEDLPEIEFVESTPEAFFRHTLAVRGGREALPVFSGDFKPNASGCYTSMQLVKQRHRRLENLLHLTEKLAAWAWWQGKREYPAADLQVAWKDLLFTEFHDILPGSGIPQVEADSLAALSHGEDTLRRKKAEVLISLLREEPLAERENTPLFVFNPHSWEVTQEVEIEYCLDRQYGPDSVVRRLTLAGAELPAQFEKGENNLDDPGWGEWRQKAVFSLTVPPLSYRRVEADYTLLPPEQVRRWQTPPLPAGDTLRVKTDRLTVAINLRTGLLDSLKVDGKAVLSGPSFRPCLFADLNHSWSTIPTWREPLAEMRLATPAEAAQIMGSPVVNADFAAGLTPVRIIEDGPIRTIIEALFVHEHSYLVQRYLISKSRPVLDVEQVVFWAEHDTMLKLELKPRRSLSRVQAENCYSVDDESLSPLPRGDEKDFQHFLRLADAAGEQAFGVISHGTLGYSEQPGTLRLNVLRSPSYATMSIAPDCQRHLHRYIPRQEQGIRTSRFTLVGGELAADTAALTRAAYEAAVPLEAFVYFPTQRRAKAPATRSFAKVDADNVLLVAMKRAEEGEALVLRLWETAGKDTAYTLTVEGKRFRRRIGARRLQTFRLERDGRLVETDLLERPLA